MKREIRKMPAVVEPLGAVNFGNDLKQWLEDQAVRNGFKWLLAHADDGVIWGRLDNGKLITSSEVNPSKVQVSPPLRGKTLLQACLFSSHGELLLWRDGDNCWRARIIRDAANGEKPDWDDAIDEYQILWGNNARPLRDGFTLMNDGSQGLRHIVPLKVTVIIKGSRPLRLKVRHYIQYDNDDNKDNKVDRAKDKFTGRIGGYARIVSSRLLDLTGGESNE